MLEPISFYLIKNNPAQYQWLWDFFQSEEAQNRYFWLKNQPLAFNEHEFYFENNVFARARKEKNKDRDDVFEALVNHCSLGYSSDGEIQPIAFSLSKDKQGNLQVRNKKRLVKIFDHADLALAEFKHAVLTKHLHAKPPNQYCMVMKEKKGSTLLQYLQKHQTLTLEERIALTKDLLAAIKREVHDNDLIHCALAPRNILIQPKTNTSGTIKYAISIINFAHARVKSTHEHLLRQDFISINYLLSSLWQDQPIPYHLTKISQILLDPQTKNLDACLDLADKMVAMPNYSSQVLVNNLFATLDTANLSLHTMKTMFAEQLKKAAQQGLHALQKTVNEYRKKLKAEGIKDTAFSQTIFHLDEKKQGFINQQFEAINALKGKIQRLKNTPFTQDRKDLKNCTRILQKQLLKVAKASSAEQFEVWLRCKNESKKALENSKGALDRHLDYHYLFAEGAVVLASLVVFYPIIAGLYYLATNKLGFFTQTKASQQAEQMINHFSSITAER